MTSLIWNVMAALGLCGLIPPPCDEGPGLSPSMTEEKQGRQADFHGVV